MNFIQRLCENKTVCKFLGKLFRRPGEYIGSFGASGRPTYRQGNVSTVYKTPWSYRPSLVQTIDNKGRVYHNNNLVGGIARI